MDPQRVQELKQLVNLFSTNPSLLHHPSLSFFKDYLQSVGAKIPQNPNQTAPMKGEYDGVGGLKGNQVDTKNADQKVDKDEHKIYESDLELEGGTVEPDNDPPQKMGDLSVEVSEENKDAAQSYKAKATEEISEGRYQEAIEHLTEAILLNPSSAILYATRASVFIKMKKPNAAMRDADFAVQINPDSAKGYKARGMAKAMLGSWEDAATDLRLASKLDYDEEIDSVLKKVERNVQKIEEHRRKYDRLRKERELKKAEHERERMHAEAERDSLAALKDGQVISIHSASELDNKLKAASKLSRLCILYFTATWCGPCRFIAPVFTNLAEKNPKVVFLKVDIDELGSIAHRWNVNSVPTFFFLKSEKEVDRVVGADKNEIERKIALHAVS